MSKTGIRLSKTFEFACCILSKIIIQFFSFLIFASIASNNFFPFNLNLENKSLIISELVQNE